MLNHVVLMGRLVADPELRTTTANLPVATFRLAVDRDYKNKQTGEKECDFVHIVAWRSTAEFVSRYFTKGRMAIVEGRLQVRTYTDQNNIKRTIAEVVANNVYFGDSKRSSADATTDYPPPPPPPPPYMTAQPQQGSADNYSAPATDSDQFAELADEDGDLPF